MLLYGRREIRPNEGDELIEYLVPANNYIQLESVSVWTNSDGHFTIYKNGEIVGEIRLSEFTQHSQIFFNEALNPLDVVSVYSRHGQGTVQEVGCTMVLKQL